MKLYVSLDLNQFNWLDYVNFKWFGIIHQSSDVSCLLAWNIESFVRCRSSVYVKHSSRVKKEKGLSISHFHFVILFETILFATREFLKSGSILSGPASVNQSPVFIVQSGIKFRIASISHTAVFLSIWKKRLRERRGEEEF